jgi:hypothetical protein
MPGKVTGLAVILIDHVAASWCSLKNAPGRARDEDCAGSDPKGPEYGAVMSRWWMDQATLPSPGAGKGRSYARVLPLSWEHAE